MLAPLVTLTQGETQKCSPHAKKCKVRGRSPHAKKCKVRGRLLQNARIEHDTSRDVFQSCQDVSFLLFPEAHDTARR